MSSTDGGPCGAVAVVRRVPRVADTASGRPSRLSVVSRVWRTPRAGRPSWLLVTLDAIIRRPRALGDEVVGPVVRDGAIVHGRILGVTDVASGWHDDQVPGSLSLRHGETDPTQWGWAVGTHSWMAPFFPAHEDQWRPSRRRRDRRRAHSRRRDERGPVVRDPGNSTAPTWSSGDAWLTELPDPADVEEEASPGVGPSVELTKSHADRLAVPSKRTPPLGQISR